jgi:hypothetical protein
MGSCFSSPEAQPSKPANTTLTPTAAPAVNRATGPKIEMSNATGATPATQQTDLIQKAGPLAVEGNTLGRHNTASSPIDGDIAPEPLNPMADNDFTSALNSAPEAASGGVASPSNTVSKGGQPARAERDRSYAIDKLIEEDSKKFKKECKILLLGRFRPWKKR